jgi:hypothetical protein
MPSRRRRRNKGPLSQAFKRLEGRAKDKTLSKVNGLAVAKVAVEKECVFRWDMERMKDRNYVYFFWNGENEKARDEVFGALERKYGIRQSPPTARILYQEYADRYVFVAEDGVYATDTIECERIVLISRDCWKAQETLLTKGLIGTEGPWRAEGQ